MEDKKEPKDVKEKPVTSTISLRVKRETRKLIFKELGHLNKKVFGRRIKEDDLVRLALSLLTDEHREHLKNASLSNADRIELKFKEFLKEHPGVSKDEFLGTLLTAKYS